MNIGNKQTPGENNEVNRQNAFGFMRLVFAAMVVYSHAWFLAGPELEPYASWLFNGADTPGGIGVKCFFILSGFLVIRSECRSRSTRGFLWKRGLRIYPGLWGCLVMTGLVFPWLSAYVLKIGTIDWGNAWSYVWHNAVHPRQQIGITGMFSQIHYPGELNGSLWTLPYELGCYAIVGLVGWLGLTQGKARGTWFVGGGLLLLYFTDIIRGDEALYFKQGNRMIIGYFALGSLVGLLSDLQLRKLFSPLLVGGLMLAWVVSWRAGGSDLIAPWALTALVMWGSWSIPFRSWESRLGGDYSYGLYIYGFPVQQMLAGAGLVEHGIWIYFGVSLLITAGFAVASWHLIEKPALRWKSQFR